MMMRMRIFVFLVLAVCPAWAAITLVQSQNSGNNSNCHATAASTGAACTVAATTLGNDVLLHIGWHANTVSLTKVVGSSSSALFVIYSQQKNGAGTTGSASAWLVCRHCPALTSVTPTFSGSTKYEITMLEYSGVTWMGIPVITTGTSTAPGFTTGAGTAVTTGDNNDVIACGIASVGTSGVPTSGNGTFRKAAQTGSTTADVSVGVADATSASPASVQCSLAITSAAWSASAIELRTTAPQTFIWPDCDATHPCLIYHYGRPALPLEAIGPLARIWVRPSLASNLIFLTITHPGTISSIVDANSNTWASGPSAAGSGFTTDVRYVCGAAVGSGGQIDITLSGAIAPGDIFQINYDEVSGIATSSCNDGTATAATALSAGAMQPGSITTTVDGDMIYTFGIDGTGNMTNGFQSGWEMPDDSSAQLWNSMFEYFISTVRVQTTHGAINPTLNVAAMDINEQTTWQLVAQAYKFSNGAGTQPPAGKAWVVRDVIGWNNAAASLSNMAAPSNGNAVVFATDYPQTNIDMTQMINNQGETYTENTLGDTTRDPQQFYSCLGAGGANRDRTFQFPNGSTSRLIQYYDIAGAKTSGCAGNKVTNKTGTQGGSANANLVSSTFGSPFTFTPTLNGAAYSVVVVNTNFDVGPLKGPCNSGGTTPPTCTNDMTPFVYSSMWATGMGDASHWSSGDADGWYSTNSASSTSFDFFAANSVDSPSGGTGIDFSVLEILGSAGSVVPNLWAIQP